MVLSRFSAKFFPRRCERGKPCHPSCISRLGWVQAPVATSPGSNTHTWAVRHLPLHDHELMYADAHLHAAAVAMAGALVTDSKVATKVRIECQCIELKGQVGTSHA